MTCFTQNAQIILSKASQLLKKFYVRHMVRKYVSEVTPQRKAQVLPRGPERFTMFKFMVIIIHVLHLSMLLAPAEITNKLHVQRQEGKLPVQCV